MKREVIIKSVLRSLVNTSFILASITFIIPNLALAQEPNALIAPITGDQKPAQQVAKIESKDFVQTLKTSGVTYQVINGKLNVSIDQQTALSTIPSLQQSDAFSQDITPTDIKTHPVTYSAVIALYYTTQILLYVYKNSTVETMNVDIFLLSSDDFGNKKKDLIISFDFNRDLYNKINWPNFPAQNLQKITPNFKFSQWYTDKVKTEQ